jgi:predicted dehydrogenase
VHLFDNSGPNNLHSEPTIAAAEAGKHVICEKPLGLDAEQARAMHDAAHRAGRVLLEGFFYRWHPRMRRIEQLVGSGDLGTVEEVSSQFCFDGGDGLVGNYRLDPARGGGALYDVGVYPISAAHAVLGPELAVSQARSRTGGADVGAGPVDLEVEGELVSATGAVVRFRCAIDGPTGQNLVVNGSDGALATDQGETFTNWHAPSTLTVRTTVGGGAGGKVSGEATGSYVESFEAVDPYRLMVEGFAAHLRGEADLLVGREDSLAVAGTTDAIRAALHDRA